MHGRMEKDMYGWKRHAGWSRCSNSGPESILLHSILDNPWVPRFCGMQGEMCVIGASGMWAGLLVPWYCVSCWEVGRKRLGGFTGSFPGLPGRWGGQI